MNQKAFTLIELSIVLVIISLIVGGVLVGQSLIQAAKLRSIVSDAEKFKTAGYTFRLKYNAMPGDIPNAKTFWPDDSQYAGFETWNGNGNKMVDYSYEDMRFFQHLSLADLIPGEYLGGNSDITLVAGTHIPKGPFGGSGYMAFSSGGLIILFGSSVAASPRRHDNHILTPLDAKSIDDKYDDGLANQGHFWAFDPHTVNTGCTTVHAGSIYDLTQTEANCRVGFTY